MLHKVIKHTKKMEKQAGKNSGTVSDTYRPLRVSKKDGFHPKVASTKGAARQRSIGNRNQKSG